MLATLIQIDAWDPVAAAPVTLRAASHDHPALCHLDGAIWWPAIAQLPKLRYDFFSGSFDGSIETPSSSTTLIVEPFPDLPRLSMADARLRLWTGELGAAWDAFTLRFDGIVTAQPRIENYTASIDFAADDRWLDTPLLDLYEGTTGIEGEAGQKGTPKPLALGQPRYVPGQMIDSIDTILQLSAYGPLQAIDAALERLVRFPVSAGDFPNLAALKAAAIPRGGWATCKALGLVRHGAPLDGMPSYLLKGDAAGPDGWARKPGQIIRRLAHMLGHGDRLSDASLNALDLARPWNLSMYLGDQVTAREIIQRIAASVNAVAGVTWLGKLFVAPIAIGEASLTLRSDGTALPVVGDVEQVAVGQPYWRMALQAVRTWQLHALSDIAFSAVLIERGRYDAAESYREGHIVDMPDGSRWLHIGTAPTTGVAPGSDAAVWFSLSAALDPADIRYDGGTGPTLQDLKPAEAGATAGAPAGTYVADRLAEQVVADALAALAITEEARAQLATMLTSYLQNMMLQETRDARLQALSWLDGDHLHTVQRRETTERIEGDTAIVTVMNLIGAKSLDGSAFILDIDTVKVGPTESLAERLTEIDATFDSQSAEMDANFTALTTAVANEEEARTTAITTLAAEVDGLASDTAAQIVNVQDAVADEASARATAITSLTSTVTSLSGTVSANYSTLNTAISNETSARSSALTTVNSTLNSHGTTLGSHTSSISSLSSTLSTLTTTEANHYSTLTTSIGGVSSTVTAHSSAITTLQGRTAAYWGITTNAGSGATAFIAAQAETSPGSVTSNVAFGAREVHISNPIGGAWTKVLSISGGNVQIFGKLTATDAVTTTNILADNVTKTTATFSGGNVTATGAWIGLGAYHTIVLPYAADVIALYFGNAGYIGSTPLNVRFILYNSGGSPIAAAEGPGSGDGAYMSNPSFPARWSLSAGTYYVDPQFVADNGDLFMKAGSGVITFVRYR